MIRSTVFNNAHRAGAAFLRIDCEVGLTFSGISLGANEEQKRRRTTAVARNAYDTIMRLRSSIELTQTERIELDRNLLRLKGELQILGETF